MLTLSIRQPWAWLIVYGGKDIENRDWFTRVRGRVLVHAGKGCTRQEYEDAVEFCQRRDLKCPPPLDTLARGGIIGSVEIVDCVRSSPSPWFLGGHGFVLRDARPLPWTPWRGQLGFFDVPLQDEAAREPAC